MVVKKAKPLRVECIVRGYLSGSGWKEYQAEGSICGLALPKGMKESAKLPEPIFTPSTKAEIGIHDENIDFAGAVKILGKDLAEQVRSVSLRIYQEASALAEGRGILIADTKFEFGLDEAGKLILIDEALTPDSSRFWPKDGYAPGGAQKSFDKQFVRDYLLSLKWDQKPPAPAFRRRSSAGLRKNMWKCIERLTGRKLERIKRRRRAGTAGTGSSPGTGPPQGIRQGAKLMAREPESSAMSAIWIIKPTRIIRNRIIAWKSSIKCCRNPG